MNTSKKLPHAIAIFLIVVNTLMMQSCSIKNYAAGTNYNFKSVNGKPDYSNLDFWAAHPWKKNASDMVPKSLAATLKDSLADVFFIYPTTYLDSKMDLGWNAPVDNETINRKTDNTTILYQASVFNSHCRIFSPRYRQAHLKAFYTTDTLAAQEAFRIAYDDIKTAFQYYLKYYNQGRPIIIASHSQGTKHAQILLKEFFEYKDLKKLLVCAYIIGLPVITDYFTDISLCKDSSATGCFVSWRTFRRGTDPAFVKKEIKKAYVINPLTWKADAVLAPALLNHGGILKNFNKIVPGIVSSQVHGSILWASRPKFFGNIFLSATNYHIADYNLFYLNIRENVNTRIVSFLNKNK